MRGRRQYYRDGSCARYVPHVRVPLLCMNALDDPICQADAIPVDECWYVDVRHAHCLFSALNTPFPFRVVLRARTGPTRW